MLKDNKSHKWLFMKRYQPPNLHGTDVNEFYANPHITWLPMKYESVMIDIPYCTRKFSRTRKEVFIEQQPISELPSEIKINRPSHIDSNLLNPALHTESSTGASIYLQADYINKIRDQEAGKIFEVSLPEGSSEGAHDDTAINNTDLPPRTNDLQRAFEYQPVKREVRFSKENERIEFDRNRSSVNLSPLLKRQNSGQATPEHPSITHRFNRNYRMESIRAKGCDLIDINDFEMYTDIYEHQREGLQNLFETYRSKQLSRYNNT